MKEKKSTISEKKDNNKTLIVYGVLFCMSFFLYACTIILPVIGDGLMHMNDNTDLSLKNILYCFFTFEGLNKPSGSYLTGFHRPIFNELIIEILKKISGYSVVFIRSITVLSFALSSIISYKIGKEVFCSDNIKSIGLAVLTTFSISRFPGVYDVGLSFSVWLTLFLYCALYFTIRYEKNGSCKYLILSLVFTFLTLFTKESAMTIGVALSFYMFVKEFAKTKRISNKLIIFSLGQGILLAIYLLTRYMKLGSLFTVATGINAEYFSMMECIKKIIGFFFLALNIPTRICFEPYMCVQLQIESIFFAVVIGCIVVLSIYQFIKCIINKEQCVIDSLVFLGCYLIVLLPVFKTTRNATYYGDILSIFVLLFILSSLKNNIHLNKYKKPYNHKKCNIIFLSGLLISYVTIFSFNLYDYVKPNTYYYLGVISNETTQIRDLMREENINTESVYVTSNFMKNSNCHFIYNHMGYGSFYKYNVDVSKDTDLLTQENISTIKNHTVIDFYRCVDDGTYTCFFYDLNTERYTNIVEVQYLPENNKSIAIGFYYNDKYYYSEIDIDFKKTWCNDDKIYIVVPDNVVIDVQGSDCILRTIYE